VKTLFSFLRAPAAFGGRLVVNFFVGSNTAVNFSVMFKKR
jgi:hypothetical protein